MVRNAATCNEDACFIAATPESAQEFLDVSCLDPRDGRITMQCYWDDPRSRDYGCSSGEYALEAAAFTRFRTLPE